MCSSLPLIIGGDLLDVKKPGAIPRRTPRNRNNASTKRKASEREGKGEVQEAEEEVMAAAAEELSTPARVPQQRPAAPGHRRTDSVMPVLDPGNLRLRSPNCRQPLFLT